MGDVYGTEHLLSNIWLFAQGRKAQNMGRISHSRVVENGHECDATVVT
jgi:hypothetical protein